MEEEIKTIKINDKKTLFNLGDTIELFKNKKEVLALVISIRISLDNSINYQLEWVDNNDNFVTETFSERELKRILEINKSKTKIGFE